MLRQFRNVKQVFQVCRQLSRLCSATVFEREDVASVPLRTTFIGMDTTMSITICTTIRVSEDHNIEVLASPSKLHRQFLLFTLARSLPSEVVEVEVEVVAQVFISVGMVDGEHTYGIVEAELITSTEASSISMGINAAMGIAEPPTIIAAPHDHRILFAGASVCNLEL
jgi:hypothetical protein